MHDIEFKSKLKEIYDFVDQEKLKSFYVVGYDYHPSVRLIDLLDKNQKLEPNFCIHLKSSIDTWIEDKKKLEERFPSYFILFF
jgi:hypothetical protein